jgi:hypothetical protein
MTNNFNFYLDQLILTTLHEGIHAFLCISQVQVTRYLPEKKMPQTKVVEKNDTRFMFDMLSAKVL